MILSTTSVFAKNLQAYLDGARLIINQGSTSSSKTYSILQLLVLIAEKSDHPLLISVVSESFPHLRRGCIKDFKKIMGKRFRDKNWNKTNSTYTLGVSTIEFFSADVPSKLRGGRRDILFLNEANNINKEAFDELSVRTSKCTFIDYNPVGEFWAHELIGLPKTAYIHSTFMDAADLVDPAVIEDIVSRKDRDPNWWRIYGLGLTGKIKGLIHPDFEQIDMLPSGGREIYGLDFGYSQDPAALVKLNIIGDCLYAQELLYQTEMTNQKIAKYMELLGVRKHYDIIIADCAEPKSIAEIREFGFDIRPCAKGPDSVRVGIQKVNQYKQYWTKDSLNGIKEQRNYRWEENTDGKLTTKPIDDYSHLMDARRMAVFTMPEPKVIQRKVKKSAFSINFSNLSERSQLLLSIWTEKNLKTSVIGALWSSQNGHLYVQFELDFTAPIADDILSRATAKISEITNRQITSLKNFHIWGNEVFFDEWGGDLSTDFQRLGMHIRENEQYNEMGAVAMVSKMASAGTITIHDRCSALDDQLGLWRITGKPEEGFGYARALLSIVSTLYKSGKFVEKPKPLKEYSEAKQKAFKRIEDIKNKAGSEKPKNPEYGRHSWMI